MKDAIIIIVIISLVAFGNFFSQNILKKDIDILIEKLEKLRDELYQENANQMISEIYDLWEETEKKWSMIVSHQELDLIKTSVIGAKSGIESGDLNYSYEQIESSIFLIGHIKEKTTIKWKNVF